MATASANATPMIIGKNTVPLASGLRPIASIALPTAMPMPMPGPIAPRPIARPAPSTPYDGACCSIRSKNIPSSSAWSASRPLIGRERSPRLVLAGGCRLVVKLLVLGRQGHEREREQGEDQGLHQADEQLEAQEQRREKDRHQAAHDR